MTVTDAQIDAAIPVAGEPSRALTNAVMKDLSGEFEASVDLTGGTTQLSKTAHRSTLLVLVSGTNTITAPATAEGTYTCAVLNISGSDQTILGQTVSDNSYTALTVRGAVVTSLSTSRVERLTLMVVSGRDGTLYKGAPFSGPYTILTVKAQAESGDIDLTAAIENSVNANDFTNVTGAVALDVTTTRVVGTATGAQVSDNQDRRLLLTGSNNDSASVIDIEVTARV